MFFGSIDWPNKFFKNIFLEGMLQKYCTMFLGQSGDLKFFQIFFFPFPAQRKIGPLPLQPVLLRSSCFLCHLEPYCSFLCSRTNLTVIWLVEPKGCYFGWALHQIINEIIDGKWSHLPATQWRTSKLSRWLVKLISRDTCVWQSPWWKVGGSSRGSHGISPNWLRQVIPMVNELF